ncbi:MAG: hypothetical protein K2X86_17755 [Cytophagaceae bacterium]|nr:hypothetical protein [Cytophagaceae bacterium]
MNFNEFTYSGAEDVYSLSGFFGGEVTKGTGTVNTTSTYVHTGTSSLKLAQNQEGFTYKAAIGAGGIDIDRKYRATVWIYDNGNTTAKLYYKLQTAGGVDVTTPNQGEAFQQ